MHFIYLKMWLIIVKFGRSGDDIIILHCKLSIVAIFKTQPDKSAKILEKFLLLTKYQVSKKMVVSIDFYISLDSGLPIWQFESQEKSTCFTYYLDIYWARQNELSNSVDI